jgi:hypothetical protein
MNRSSRQKVSQAVAEFTSTIHPLDLPDICRYFVNKGRTHIPQVSQGREITKTDQILKHWVIKHFPQQKQFNALSEKYATEGVGTS